MAHLKLTGTSDLRSSYAHTNLHPTLPILSKRYFTKAMDVHVLSSHRLPTSWWTLSWPVLAGFTLVCILNQILSRKALNHRERASFDWTREIVLVTGGSGGIGGDTVQELAKKGTRIVVLDVPPLAYKARK